MSIPFPGFTPRPCFSQVGRAIQTVLKSEAGLTRDDLFVESKHWRSYHGYDLTNKCLNLSLSRLQVRRALLVPP